MAEGRDEKGRALPGNNIRATAQKTRAKVLSRKLLRVMKKRYATKLGPDGEPLGPDGATLRTYIVAMDIMDDIEAKPEARLKAAEFVANRVDGKPVQAIELTGAEGGPVQSESTVTANDAILNPAERLALALKSLGLLAQHGGLHASGQAGGVGGGSASGDEGPAGGGGGGEQAP